ncbi:hypothetical protein SAY86_008245 [Trapa natans]|uniref:RING-type E3 ubiquitin transferase n=1 Tax=Trapa natans TaxID=22666 RepID=A0AAN7K9U9_TRANT|nr:hypothetical protein SAY86_008245 [Trapa natans]
MAVDMLKSYQVYLSSCPFQKVANIFANHTILDLAKEGSGPYIVALKYKHGACAAFLNPASAEPLVWPSPLKLISDLNQDAKALLERALKDANKEREKSILKDIAQSLPSPPPRDSELGVSDDISEASENDLCCICFERLCSIEVRDCSHRMCARCILSLCCHNKPNPTGSRISPPSAPFVEAQYQAFQLLSFGVGLALSALPIIDGALLRLSLTVGVLFALLDNLAWLLIVGLLGVMGFWVGVMMGRT